MRKLFACIILALTPAAAAASETVTYSYDAKGRLTTVAHNGSVNNRVVTNYTFDKADNRINLTVSGSLFDSPQRRIAVVPLKRLSVIVIPDP